MSGCTLYAMCDPGRPGLMTATSDQTQAKQCVAHRTRLQFTKRKVGGMGEFEADSERYARNLRESQVASDLANRDAQRESQRLLQAAQIAASPLQRDAAATLRSSRVPETVMASRVGQKRITILSSGWRFPGPWSSAGFALTTDGILCIGGRLGQTTELRRRGVVYTYGAGGGRLGGSHTATVKLSWSGRRPDASAVSHVRAVVPMTRRSEAPLGGVPSQG
jgi:hypothetical protein